MSCPSSRPLEARARTHNDTHTAETHPTSLQRQTPCPCTREQKSPNRRTRLDQYQAPSRCDAAEEPDTGSDGSPDTRVLPSSSPGPLLLKSALSCVNKGPEMHRNRFQPLSSFLSGKASSSRCNLASHLCKRTTKCMNIFF